MASNREYAKEIAGLLSELREVGARMVAERGHINAPSVAAALQRLTVTLNVDDGQAVWAEEIEAALNEATGRGRGQA